MPENIADVLRTVREVAEHGSDIKHLQTDLDKLSKDIEDIKKTLEAISKTLSEASGGWRILMLVGSGAATLGAIVSWLIDLIRQ
ncbi:MAG: hypothetical protein RIR39_1543 [Pseudomonadota bacterium]|jgi:prefoldin subunit 5